MADQEKEIAQFQNRLKDLANKSFQQGIYTFSSFLSLAEQDVYHRMERELQYASPMLWGGHEEADRVMLRFGNNQELGYEIPFPIVCIHIRPMVEKFGENLSHRDFLGALMNLGIERSTLGDIKAGEKDAYLFCQESMAAYICENLDQVRHTHVKLELVENPEEMPQEEPEIISVQVASARADALIAKVCKLSREESLNLFRAGKVFINGRLCENNSKQLADGDVVNARGFGKFALFGESRTTKKGKESIQVKVYR